MKLVSELFLLVLVLGSICLLVHGYNETKTLYFMTFLPMSGGGWTGGYICLPAMNLAIEHVNARADILPGYKLNMIWVDTMVSF